MLDEIYQTPEEADFMLDLQRDCGMPAICRPVPANGGSGYVFKVTVDCTDRATKRAFTKGDIIYNVFSGGVCQIEGFNYIKSSSKEYPFLKDQLVDTVDVLDLTTAETKSVSVENLRDNYCLDLAEWKKYVRKQKIKKFVTDGDWETFGFALLSTVIVVGIFLSGIALWKHSDVKLSNLGLTTVDNKVDTFEATVKYLNKRQELSENGQTINYYTVSLDSKGKIKTFYIPEDLFNSLTEGQTVTVNYAVQYYDEFNQKIEDGSVLIGNARRETTYSINDYALKETE